MKDCLGGLVIDNHLLTYSNELMLVHRASPPWADEGEPACGAPAKPANSEIDQRGAGLQTLFSISPKDSECYKTSF